MGILLKCKGGRGYMDLELGLVEKEDEEVEEGASLSKK